MKIISTIVFISTFILGTSYVYAQEKIRLGYDFKPGNKLDYQVKIDGDVTVEVKNSGEKVGRKNSARIEGKIKYSHEVVSVNRDKSADINVIYGPSYMNTIVSDQVLPNSDVKLLDGKVARLKVKQTGEVEDFKLPEGLPLSLQNADFKKMFLIFPHRDLKVGESWIENFETTDDKDENYVVKSLVNSTYTLLGEEKKGKYECAKVKLLGSSATTTKSKNPEIKLDGKALGRIEGIIYFDLKSGHIVSSDLKTKINNTVISGRKEESSAGNKNLPFVTTIMDTDLKTVTELL